jgi:hypothetical protein
MKRFICTLVVLTIVSIYGCAGMTETQRGTGLAAIAGGNPAVGGGDWGLTDHIIGQPVIPPRIQSFR